MRILFTLILICPSSLFCFSQPEWNIVLDGNSFVKSYAQDLAILNDSVVLVGGNSNIYSCYGSFIKAFDINGNKLWENEIGADAIQTKDNIIYSIGYKLYYSSNSEYLTLSKYNGYGDTLSFSIYDSGIDIVDDNGYYDEECISLEVTPNNEFLFLSDSIFVKADSTGKVLWKKGNSSISNFRNLRIIDETEYIVSTQKKLLIVDSSIITLDSIVFAEEIKQNLIEQDTIYCLLNNASVISLDNSLSPLDTLDFSIHFDKVFHLKKDSGILWISGEKNDKLIFQSFELGSESRNIYTFNNIINFKSFEIIGDNLFILGDSKSEQVTLLKYTLSDESGILELYNQDVVFEDLIIDSIEFQYINQEKTISNGFNFYSRAIISNQGEDTVYSVALYSKLNGGTHCFQNQKYIKFNDIVIAPGESDTVSLGKSFEYGQYNTSTLCFECLAPNSKIDIDASNNSSCKTIDVYNSINQNNFTSTFNVYPNPFDDNIIISSSINIQRLMVTDITGKIILEENIQSKEFTLFTENWNPGVYFLILNSKENIFVRKLIKK